MHWLGSQKNRSDHQVSLVISQAGGVKLTIILSLMLLGLVVLVWPNLQLVVDYAQGFNFRPSVRLKQLTDRLHLTSRSHLILKASRPQLQTKQQFNHSCPRKEASLYILGCYNGHDIFVYQVDNQELAGVGEVTLAHELLHAIYRRLDSQRRARVNQLLRADYQRLMTDELKQRMAAYNRTQPDQLENELHSILGTEFANLSTELEEHYRYFFSDRQAIVKMHQASQRPFKQKQQELEELKTSIDQFEQILLYNKHQYDDRVDQFNQRVQQFNQRAQQPGGFASQEQFDLARAELVKHQQLLQADHRRLTEQITSYNQQIDRYNQTNLAMKRLNSSLDSLAEPILEAEEHHDQN